MFMALFYETDIHLKHVNKFNFQRKSSPKIWILECFYSIFVIIINLYIKFINIKKHVIYSTHIHL